MAFVERCTIFGGSFNRNTSWYHSLKKHFAKIINVQSNMQEERYSNQVVYTNNVSEFMNNHMWSDVRRVAYANLRNEANIVSKAVCGDFIIPSGNKLVYTKLNKQNAEDIEIHQIISVLVEEDMEYESTNCYYAFERFIKEYENGRYEGTSIEEFREYVRLIAEEVLGREVNITVCSAPNFKSNRKNGLAGKEETSRGLNYHFGDEQDGRGDSSEGSRTQVSHSDRTMSRSEANQLAREKVNS